MSLLLLASSCMGALEARMRMEASRVETTSNICRGVMYDPAGNGLSAIGGPFEWDGGMANRLPSLLAGPGVILDDLKSMFGERGEFDLAGLLKTPAAHLSAAAVEMQRASANADETNKKLIDEITKQLADFEKGRDDFVAKVGEITIQAKELRGLLQEDLHVDVRLNLTVQLDNTRKIFTVLKGSSKQIDALVAAGRDLPELVRSFETSLALLRAAVEDAKESGAISGGLAASIETGVGQMVEVMRTYAAWIEEARAIRDRLAAVKSGNEEQFEQLINALGQQLQVRGSSIAARLMFRVAESALRYVDQQLAALSREGYGAGMLSASFAGSVIDRFTLKLGKRLGAGLQKSRVGVKPFVYEACRSIAEDGDSYVVIGMTAFYQGLISGYDDEQAKLVVQKEEVASSTATSAMPVELTDLVGDFAALRDCFASRGWHANDQPCDRDQLRLAAVQVLMASPPTFDIDVPTSDLHAPPIGAPPPPPTDGGTPPPQPPEGGTLPPVPEVGQPPQIPGGGPDAQELPKVTIDKIVVAFVHARGRDRDGGTGSGSSRKLELDSTALNAQLEKLVKTHDVLIEAMKTKESHWRTTQFVAALCGATDGGRVNCSERDTEDAVATLRLLPPVGGLPDGEWEPYDGRFCKEGESGCAERVASGTACYVKASRRDSEEAADCARLRKDRDTNAKRQPNLSEYESDATALAYNVRVLGKAFESHTPVEVIVTGSASGASYSCKEALLPRLLMQRSLERCGPQRGRAGEHLCYEIQGAKVSLRSGDLAMSCDAANADSAAANLMLAILRGWRVREVVLSELKKNTGDTWKERVRFSFDPPNAGACEKPRGATATERELSRARCARKQSVMIQVLPARVPRADRAAPP